MANTNKRGQFLSGKVQKGSHEHLLERQRYLTEIVDEFHLTKSKDVKKQILANLVNFSYDPYNYRFFLQLDVIGIFLQELERTNDRIINRFCLSGLSNLSPSEIMGRQIVQNNGISIISKYLHSTQPESIVSAITTLMYLKQLNPGVHVATDELMSQMHTLAQHEDNRIKNVATIFIQDTINFYNSPNQLSN